MKLPDFSPCLCWPPPKVSPVEPTPSKSLKTDDATTAIFATFAASPGELFAALTEPKHLANWMSATGFVLDSVTVDARVGGGFCYVYRREDFEGVATSSREAVAMLSRYLAGAAT